MAALTLLLGCGLLIAGAALLLWQAGLIVAGALLVLAAIDLRR